MIVGLKEEVPADESSLVVVAVAYHTAVVVVVVVVDHTAAVDRVADFASTVGCNSADTAVGTVEGIVGGEGPEADPNLEVEDPVEDHSLGVEGVLEVCCTVGYCSFVYLSRGTFLQQLRVKKRR